VPIYKKSDKTGCSNYRNMSLLSTTYKLLSKVNSIRRGNHWGSSIGQLLIIQHILQMSNT
jgi:hypothetical protein